MNNAPFKVGQKVVCIDDSKDPKGVESPLNWRVVKGSIYTIFRVGIGVDKLGNESIDCSLDEDPEKEFYSFKCSRFAPLDEPKERIRYVAVSETLREQAVEIAAIETN